MLPRSHRQEALSRAYVHAVAAQAGVVCEDAWQDFGIDVFLRALEIRGGQCWDVGPQLDAQLKCTTRAEIREDAVAYDLEVRSYNLLRENVLVRRPRILILLVLPDEEERWLDQTVEELRLRRCAYWMSLRGSPATTAQTTSRIFVPRANVFSVEALHNLLNLLRQGGLP